MKAATLKSVADMDIRVFPSEELLSLRDEIGKELETREKGNETPSRSFSIAGNARDVCYPICGCHRYCDDGMRRWNKS